MAQLPLSKNSVSLTKIGGRYDRFGCLKSYIFDEMEQFQFFKLCILSHFSLKITR